MNIPPIFEEATAPSDPDYVPYLSQVLIRFWGLLARVVNGGIEAYARRDNNTLMAANIRGFLWQGNITGSSTVIPHNLGYAPIGFIVLSLTSSAIPYFVSSTKTTITVNASGNALNTVLLIL